MRRNNFGGGVIIIYILVQLYIIMIDIYLVWFDLILFAGVLRAR